MGPCTHCGPTDLIGTIFIPAESPRRSASQRGKHRAMAIGEQIEAASRRIFNGYRWLENPHQNCVDYLSLGTLRNGLSCLRLALRPFLCLLDYGRLPIFAVVTQPLQGLIQLIDRDRLPSGRPMPSVCTVRSRASMASYMRSLPQTSAMIEPMARKTFVASSSKALGPR